ncbi:arylsulfatase [Neiella marina]|uniref:Arylsulfatase n=1 Tax=Neiella marina TaxID=508461 RepID=A0A8J2XNK4_9GAMM|nr:arylsulfatase [Neiella marina]GGA72678.1 arylsulfatase [Neiella marina]
MVKQLIKIISLGFAMTYAIASHAQTTALVEPSLATDNHASARPNILLIQVDDMGFDDLSSHGNTQVDTPSIDALAAESVRFGQFYVNPLCAPSRASLLTGRHFLRTGVSGVHGGRDYIHLDETLVSELLQRNGYATGMWGKWHSGKSDGYFPWDRGFDEAYYASLYNYFDNNGLLNGQQISTKGSATKAITDMAIDFIQRHKNQPFFAYVPYMAPHNPWRAPAESIEKYLGKGLSFPAASLYGMIDNLDGNIGRLLEELDKQHLADNTIVVFLSDNGPWIKSYRFGLNDQEWQLRNPNGRKGRKGDTWENGVRSPLFIRWPGKYQPQHIDSLSQVEDLFPTLLDWAGIAVPKELELDGISLVDGLVDPNNFVDSRTLINAWASPLVPEQQHHSLDSIGFYAPLTPRYRNQIQFDAQRLAIRQGQYKLVRNEQIAGQHALFDIANDPKEQHNLLAKKPELTKHLNGQLQAWYQGILASPRAMTMPEFQVGYQNRITSQVNAYAPADLSDDLINKDHFLANWTHPGQWASYNTKVHTAGNYQVYLISKMKHPADHTFKLSVGSDSVEASLKAGFANPVGTLIRNESAYWQDFDRYETFKHDIHNSYLGQIELGPGKAQLKLEMTELRNPKQAEMLDQVIAIQLVATEQNSHGAGTDHD